MNRRELNQIYYLDKELKRCEMLLKEAEESIQAKGQKITGMPFSNTGTTSDPTSEKVIEIMKYRTTLEGYKEAIEIRKEQISLWLLGIDDYMLKLIIYWRCIKLCKWNEVADKIGGGNTEDGVKKYFYRHIPL